MTRPTPPLQPQSPSRSWMYRFAATIFCFVLPYLATPSAAFAAGPLYLSFTVPNSTATYPMSMNDEFSVTGYYIDLSGTTHGFVRDLIGHITTFDVPGSLFTKPLAINNVGEITGYYEFPGTGSPRINNPPLGFVRAANGKINTFGNVTSDPPFEAQPDAISSKGEVVSNYPSINGGLGALAFVRSPAGDEQQFTLSEGASYSTFVTSVNAGGNVVGYFSSQSIQLANGFYWDGQGAAPSYFGGYTQITYPGSTGTFPTGIDTQGNIVGCYSVGSVFHDFLLSSKGVYSTLGVPGTIPSCVASLDLSDLGVYSVLPASVSTNASGSIVGISTSGSNTSGFVRFTNGTIRTVAIPGSTQTIPTSVNGFDVLTGYYIKGSATEGFIALP